MHLNQSQQKALCQFFVIALNLHFLVANDKCQ